MKRSLTMQTTFIKIIFCNNFKPLQAQQVTGPSLLHAYMH
jgi:hypothetical protein